VTEEIAPWSEDGQSWRARLVTYPDTIVAHTRQQTYYFDDSGLLRRVDYGAWITRWTSSAAVRRCTTLGVP
jgi:hypothetical protein